jgi:hypothetical protein
VINLFIQEFYFFNVFLIKKGIIRDSFNRDYFNQIFELQTLERLMKKFISDRLLPFQSRIFVIPSQSLMLDIKIDFSEKSNTEKQINVIKSIWLMILKILTEDEPNSLNL